MNTLGFYEKIGGRDEAAKLCGVSRWATYKWDEEGIPALHWKKLAAAAKLKLEQMAAIQPSRPKQAAS